MENLWAIAQENVIKISPGRWRALAEGLPSGLVRYRLENLINLVSRILHRMLGFIRERGGIHM